MSVTLTIMPFSEGLAVNSIRSKFVVAVFGFLLQNISCGFIQNVAYRTSVSSVFSRQATEKPTGGAYRKQRCNRAALH